jgi:hypothetical protein
MNQYKGKQSEKMKTSDDIAFWDSSISDFLLHSKLA